MAGVIVDFCLEEMEPNASRELKKNDAKSFFLVSTMTFSETCCKYSSRERGEALPSQCRPLSAS